MQISRTHYKIVALGQFNPGHGPAESGLPIPADLHTLDEAMAAMRPRIVIGVDRKLCPGGFLTLQFEALKDFKPHHLIHRQPYLRGLDNARRKIVDGMASGSTPETIAREVRTACRDIPIDLKVEPPANPQREGTDTLDSIFSMVSIPRNGHRDGQQSGPGPLKWQAQIDKLLEDLIGEIFNDTQFRACEAAWRGVEALVKQGNIKAGNGIVLELVPITDQTLEATLERLAPILNDNRPDLALIDLPFDNTLVKIERLAKVADFAQNLLVPAIAWVTPHIFGVEAWAQMSGLPYLSHHMEETRFTKLRKVRRRESSHWICLTCNRFLYRYPYGEQSQPKGVSLYETQPLWISPVWALAALVAQSVSASGWPTGFTRFNDICLQDLPVGDFSGGGYCATEFLPSEDRILQLIEVGITPLAAVKNGDSAFMPRETTFFEGSLRFQQLLSRLLGVIFECRKTREERKVSGDPAGAVEAALVGFWRSTGHEPPGDLEVSEVKQPGDDGPLLNVSMTPPDSVLPGGARVEFSFAW